MTKLDMSFNDIMELAGDMDDFEREDFLEQNGIEIPVQAKISASMITQDDKIEGTLFSDNSLKIEFVGKNGAIVNFTESQITDIIKFYEFMRER